MKIRETDLIGFSAQLTCLRLRKVCERHTYYVAARWPVDKVRILSFLEKCPTMSDRVYPASENRWSQRQKLSKMNLRSLYFDDTCELISIFQHFNVWAANCPVTPWVWTRCIRWFRAVSSELSNKIFCAIVSTSPFIINLCDCTFKGCTQSVKEFAKPPDIFKVVFVKT